MSSTEASALSAAPPGRDAFSLGSGLEGSGSGSTTSVLPGLSPSSLSLSLSLLLSLSLPLPFSSSLSLAETTEASGKKPPSLLYQFTRYQASAPIANRSKIMPMITPAPVFFFGAGVGLYAGAGLGAGALTGAGAGRGTAGCTMRAPQFVQKAEPSRTLLLQLLQIIAIPLLIFSYYSV